MAVQQKELTLGHGTLLPSFLLIRRVAPSRLVISRIATIVVFQPCVRELPLARFEVVLVRPLLIPSLALETGLGFVHFPPIVVTSFVFAAFLRRVFVINLAV